MHAMYVTSPCSTGKLAGFLLKPGHLEKQAETFRICLGGLSEQRPESPKKSGGGFFQNGGITAAIFDFLVMFLKRR